MRHRRSVRTVQALGALIVACSLLPVAPGARATVPGLPGLLMYEAEGSIWTINPDGTGKQRIPGAGRNLEPSWSADGMQIAFDSDRSGTSREIWAMNADGSSARQLTLNALTDSEPSWSPEGDRILFSSLSTTTNWDIWVMNPDGTGQTQLTSTSAAERWATFSPDGTKIAFARGATELRVMNADGTDARVVVPCCGTTTSRPDWSPDGTKIAFDTNAGGAINIIDSDGANMRRFIGTCCATSPSWSPDGRFLAFTLNGDIAIGRTDGSGSLVMIDHGSASVNRVRWQTVARIPGLEIRESGGSISVTEGGPPDTYTIALATQPSAPVTVTMLADAQVTVLPSEVILRPSDWQTPRTVSVTAVDDGFDEPSPSSATILHRIQSDDADYAALPPMALAVSVVDDDLPWQYFALGDGIASGHGLADTGEPCHRSPASYPAQVATALRAERTLDFFQLACTGAKASPGTSEIRDKRLDGQVDTLLGLRAPNALGMVSISIGASDLGLDDPIRARELLCDASESAFQQTTTDATARVRQAVEQAAGRILTDPNVVVVLAELYQPLNPSPSWLNDPSVVGGVAVRVPCDLDAAYGRAEDAVHTLNRAFADVRNGLSDARRPRLRIGLAHGSFHGHEGALPGCGAQLPEENDSWVQHPGRGFTTANGGDCFHPNQRGAAALAAATLGGGDPPAGDLEPPTTTLLTPDGSVLIGLLDNTVRGRTTDGGSGVSTVLVTFTPDAGAATTSAARCPHAARLSCSWNVAPPRTPGRYAVHAQAVDRAGNLEAPTASIGVLVI